MREIKPEAFPRNDEKGFFIPFRFFSRNFNFRFLENLSDVETRQPRGRPGRFFIECLRNDF